MKTFTNKEEAISYMNELGHNKTPFLFLIDYELKNIVVFTDYQENKDILFDINGVTNSSQSKPSKPEFTFEKDPISLTEYIKGFNQVLAEIKRGNSFLLNLSYPTRLDTDLTLEEIFELTCAKYKILLKDKFVCYSPEIFVKIKNGRISSNPMKGTIDANLPNAEQTILNDSKEVAEHYTIVDLIRNDLSRVAKNVKVDRFRYVDKISTKKKDLLQISSEISGLLPDDFHSNLGAILFELLPAGSISGAPKKKTIEVIRNAEGQDRGCYTGICGIFDGENLDSGVMIRFIEKTKDQMYYRSGCGITSMSNATTEYHEMIDKVYLPIQKKSQLHE